ncbi:MAG: hypothetical protein ACEPOV_11430 [Hyphomicrobiales bacterium]
MKSLKRNNYFIIFLTIIIVCGCAPIKKTPKGKYLIKNYKINLSANKNNISSTDLYGYLPNEANKNLLGVWRYKLGFYYLGLKGKDTKFNRWLKNTIGEKPVYYNHSELTQAVSQMEKFLNKKGYFNSKITIIPKFRKRIAKVKFKVDLTEPYIINKMEYLISDTNLQRYVFQDTTQRLVKPGNIYDAYLIDEEASRISNSLRDNGFFLFSRDNVIFEVDSTIGNHKMNLFVKVNNPNQKSDELSSNKEKEIHDRYFINKVIINPHYNPLLKDNRYDTVLFTIHQGKKNAPSSYYYFVKKGKLNVRPKAITQSIFITEHKPFSLTDLQRTYRKIGGLPIFKFANIQFDTIIQQRTIADTNIKLLNCYVNLQKSKTQSYSVELEGTNSNGAFGLGTILNYRNKNIFRGGEVLNLRLSSRVQKINTGDTLITNNKQLGVFNIIQYAANVSLTFPSFLVPIRQERFPKYYNPKTTFNAGYTYQSNPTYRRNISNISFNYEWETSEFSSHYFFPIELNSIKVDGISSKVLNSLDPRIRTQFTNHLITDTRYSYIFNSQEISKKKDFYYIKTTFESSGNIINLINNLSNSPKNEQGRNTLFNIEYSQYIRADLDFKYFRYLRLNPKINMVFRSYIGVGVPYSNSESIPYEKAFVAGGANGMRGWSFRELGPGSYSGSLTPYDRIGDMQIEGNFEYRFPIYSFLNGAIFTDVGNIWLLKPSASYPGGYFKFDTFFEEMGWDTGMGFRFDFKFFIIRLDGALRLRDPARPRHNRWVINEASIKNIVWNFAIGYPF